MKVINTYFDFGPILIKPTIYKDERGYFYESFNNKEFNKIVPNITFVQDNQIMSSYGIARGLHFQKPPYAQSKLIRVISGAIVDFAVDIRKDSPSYGEWIGAYLTSENHRQLFIPKGFAHGFLSLADNTIVSYKCDEYYNKDSEGSLYALDPNIGIRWCDWMDVSCIKFSTKDNQAPLFNEETMADINFEYEHK